MTVAPQWEQVADDIRAQIESGELRPGDRLPPTDQLRERHRVAASVVRQAILALQAEGVVRGVPGVGVFVVDRVADHEGTVIVLKPPV
ncbi:winged helix-turn-helix domain-containing protein [Solwaraspora sp. WMMA2056]|uniref:winged helix-turn-helix domain-containing protein n=1 Tax=Solwaraspora sp. WMMA2056 TaxID=3015161 RepID=UPI00259BCB9A|nr:winged helix-turn-helix domain-containing protein [Solwaraspora sp. WMMA2056]WJK43277.1 winged helix-turn-helix domain-containing protein [Solwaraspora sp. WMMA2056]